MDLSLVIPCYNEEGVFSDSIRRIIDLLKLSKLDFEIVLVDDKSTDGTRELIKGVARKEKRVSYCFHGKNEGRGAAVRDGIKRARGRVVGYIDIDLEVPESNILSHYLEIERGCDVAYADRTTSSSMGVHPRTFMHVLYIYLTRFLLRFDFGDTNAGCKFFNRKKIIPVLECVKDGHWFWDTEILFRSRQAGLRMKRVPAIYVRNRKKKSTVRVFSDTVYFIKKIFQFSREVKA